MYAMYDQRTCACATDGKSMSWIITTPAIPIWWWLKSLPLGSPDLHLKRSHHIWQSVITWISAYIIRQDIMIDISCRDMLWELWHWLVWDIDLYKRLPDGRHLSKVAWRRRRLYKRSKWEQWLVSHVGIIFSISYLVSGISYYIINDWREKKKL